MDQFTHAGLSLAHRRWGHGPVHVIAFHGYGGSTQDFAPFFPALAEKVTMHAFDIWFNGQSQWPDDRPIDEPVRPAEFRELMRAYMEANLIGRAWYMGFSLGGRLAFSLLEQMPERSRGGLLLAPDGLVRNPWYRWMSRFGWGRDLYGRFQQRPDGWFATLDTMRRLRLVTEKRHQFLKGHTANLDRRKLVHDVWLSLRLLEPDLGQVVENLRREEIRCHLYMGRFDSVIPLAWGRRLQRKAPDLVQLTTLESGHMVITPGLVRDLADHPSLWLPGKGA